MVREESAVHESLSNASWTGRHSHWQPQCQLIGTTLWTFLTYQPKCHVKACLTVFLHSYLSAGTKTTLFHWWGLRRRSYFWPWISFIPLHPMGLALSVVKFLTNRVTAHFCDLMLDRLNQCEMTIKGLCWSATLYVWAAVSNLLLSQCQRQNESQCKGSLCASPMSPCGSEGASV